MRRRFRFPTNGKAYGNTEATTTAVESQTEFRFPTNGKAYGNSAPNSNPFCIICFDSLQTGKHIGTDKGGSTEFTQKIIEFRFPTNGKAYGNATNYGNLQKSFKPVSIPYKRESIWELL